MDGFWINADFMMGVVVGMIAMFWIMLFWLAIDDARRKRVN